MTLAVAGAVTEIAVPVGFLMAITLTRFMEREGLEFPRRTLFCLQAEPRRLDWL